MNVLITGGAGDIGQYFARTYADQYTLTLTDIREPADTFGGRFVQADVTDRDAMRDLCQGMDSVVHLAANRSPRATWDQLIGPNINGLYAVFQAAADAKVRRVVYASSVNANYLETDRPLREDEPPRPINLYGAAKVLGEAMLSSYAAQGAFSAIALRIAYAQPHDSPYLTLHNDMLWELASYRDVAQAIHLSIVASATIRYLILNIASDNRANRLDIRRAREMIGYRPQDDAFTIAEARDESS
jgi:uronate dehydrogenase